MLDDSITQMTKNGAVIALVWPIASDIDLNFVENRRKKAPLSLFRWQSLEDGGEGEMVTSPHLWSGTVERKLQYCIPSLPTHANRPFLYVANDKLGIGVIPTLYNILISKREKIFKSGRYFLMFPNGEERFIFFCKIFKLK